MTDLPAYIPSKDELRQRLSLHYVCAKLGIELDADDRALCPFPGHDDRKPSFYLWDGDDGNQRFWCQPCGFGGDLFDLLQRLHGGSFPEAVNQAAELLAELPPDYQPPRRAARPRGELDAAAVNAARARAATEGHADVMAVRAGLAPLENSPLAHRWGVFLRDTWGWGISDNGTIHIPHWSPQYELTGCKLRFGDGAKESLPYSRYEHLYGSWLGRRHHAVLITEGETDAVYAAWLAAGERIPLDVFAMPSGANQPIDTTWLDFLRGSRIIYLALDPDTHGVQATRNWIEALNNGGFTDLRVCCLPLGKDLRDAQPELRRLLDAARTPLQEPDALSTMPGGYVATAANGNPRTVTTWTVEPTAQLAGGDEPGFAARLTSRGVVRETVIRLADLANPSTLNKWANRHGEIFVGSEADRQRIATLIKARGSITPEVFQTDRVGLHDPPADYHFAGPTVVLPGDYIGQLPWRYAPTARSADVTGRVLLPATGAPVWRWISAFLALSSPDVTNPLLGWLAASARRPELREFPLMFIGGSSGVGKSTVARLAIGLLGSAIEIDLGANTPFILYRTLAATSSLPVFVDEWTRLSRQDTREAFQGIVPLLYTGGVAERGMADLGTMGYRVSAPTLVAGEDTFTLDRELERTICVFPTRKAQNHEALSFLQGQPVQRFGQGYHRWLTTAHDLPPFPSSSRDRVEHNRGVLLAGWETLRMYLGEMAPYDSAVPDIPAEPDLSCFEREPDEMVENVYETALSEAAALSDPNGIPVCWQDPEGRGTWVRFIALIGLLETRRLDVQLPGRSRAMRDYFAERYGKLTSSQVTPPMGQRAVRAHLIPGLQIPSEEEVTV